MRLLSTFAILIAACLSAHASIPLLIDIETTAEKQTYYLVGTKRPLEEMLKILTMSAASDPADPDPILIRPDGETPAGAIVHLIEKLRNAGMQVIKLPAGTEKVLFEPLDGTPSQEYLVDRWIKVD